MNNNKVVELTQDEINLITNSINAVFEAGFIKGSIAQVAAATALASQIIHKMNTAQKVMTMTAPESDNH